MKVFYVRVSRSDLNEQNQLNQLHQRYGEPDEVFIDLGVSGSKDFSKRPGGSSLLSYLEANPGTVVCSVALDRMGRSSLDVCSTVRGMTAQGHVFQSLREGVDFSTSTGKMVLSVITAVAEMERDNLIERTHAGLATAKKEGRIGGKRVTEQGSVARKMISEGHSVTDVMSETGLSKAMVYRIRKELAV